MDNFFQLFIVCGISLVVVTVIVWLLLKITKGSNNKDDDFD